MVSQYIWVGITIGVFFAGLGIGYAALNSNQPNFMHMTPQQMQQMMNNPQTMTQWHQTMMNNPQAMNDWMNTMMQNPDMMNQWMGTMMNNPQYMNQMMGVMMQNPQFGNWMMGSMMNNPSMINNMMTPMMNDPQFRQQMYEMMFQNPQFMQNMMNNTQFQNQWMMNPNMMDSGMMNYGMMGSIMGTPITKQNDVISTINKIENILNQVSSSYKNGDKDSAMSLATSAYLENYEYIESAIAAKDLKQMEKIELLLRVDLRNMIQNNESTDSIDAKIDSIKTELESVKKLFS
jgi:hypothetical protein